MRNFTQEALEIRKHLISPYNSGKEIIRSIITRAEDKASKSRGNKNALATLEGWTDSIVDDDYRVFDSGNEAYEGYDCGDVNNKLEYE